RLHMHPETPLLYEAITSQIPTLPPNKTVVEIYVDFYKYLFHCVKQYIIETHVAGQSLWDDAEPRIQYILSHPNKWEGARQVDMRRAMVLAGILSSDNDAMSRVSFVTEGEASLHYCICLEGYAHGKGMIIADCGGGTVDISAYSSVASTEEECHRFEEIPPTICLMKGSIFVTRNACEYLKSHLKGSLYFNDVDTITAKFDQTTKHRFRNPEEPSFVKFGTGRDNDLLLNIRAGQLRFPGHVVASFFDGLITHVVNALHAQVKRARQKIQCVLLVGGFAASPYLFSKLRESLQSLGITLCRPDSHVNKAVADSAVSFFLDRLVASRTAKHTYGIECIIHYDSSDPEHLMRKATLLETAEGEQVIPKSFSVILLKGTSVTEEQEFCRPYYQTGFVRKSLCYTRIEIFVYNGSRVTENLTVTLLIVDKYVVRCQVGADTSKIVKVERRRDDGHIYYKIEFSIVIFFGLTEMKAQIAWKENMSNSLYSTIIGMLKRPFFNIQ
ncbi:hypothetical protein FISHEDRAFT_52475, partial [Fistulina hepatica ATCC 64428]